MIKIYLLQLEHTYRTTRTGNKEKGVSIYTALLLFPKGVCAMCFIYLNLSQVPTNRWGKHTCCYFYIEGMGSDHLKKLFRITQLKKSNAKLAISSAFIKAMIPWCLRIWITKKWVSWSSHLFNSLKTRKLSETIIKIIESFLHLERV